MTSSWLAARERSALMPRGLHERPVTLSLPWSETGDRRPRSASRPVAYGCA